MASGMSLPPDARLVRTVSAVLARHGTGELATHPQDLSQGRVYRRADFTADAVRRLWRNLDTGMVELRYEIRRGSA